MYKGIEVIGIDHGWSYMKTISHATNGIYPAIAVWENVMGAFSSGDRMDFRAVLEAFAGSPAPTAKKTDISCGRF